MPALHGSTHIVAGRVRRVSSTMIAARVEVVADGISFARRRRICSVVRDCLVAVSGRGSSEAEQNDARRCGDDAHHHEGDDLQIQQLMATAQY